MKKYTIMIIIGCFFLGLGLALSSLSIYEYEYVNGLPGNNLKKNKTTINETIEAKTFYIVSDNDDTRVIEASDIEKGKLRIEVSYYKDFGNLVQNVEKTGDYKILYINVNHRWHGWTRVNKLVKLGIENLKHKKIYNYSLFFRPTIKVYVNKDDMENVKIRNY